MLDKTIHEVGADPKLYEVEHNLTSNDVTEQVIKGNVAIIKPVSYTHLAVYKRQVLRFPGSLLRSYR